MFGLFAVCGYQFSPWIADISDARLWRTHTGADYGPLQNASRHTVRRLADDPRGRSPRASPGFRRVIRRHFLRPPVEFEPELPCTACEIADAAGLAPKAVDSDVSRGCWPEPDEVRDGVKLWRGSTAAATLATRHRRTGEASRTDPRPESGYAPAVDPNTSTLIVGAVGTAGTLAAAWIGFHAASKQADKAADAQERIVRLQISAEHHGIRTQQRRDAYAQFLRQCELVRNELHDAEDVYQQSGTAISFAAVAETMDGLWSCSHVVRLEGPDNVSAACSQLRRRLAELVEKFDDWTTADSHAQTAAFQRYQAAHGHVDEDLTRFIVAAQQVVEADPPA